MVGQKRYGDVLLASARVTTSSPLRLWCFLSSGTELLIASALRQMPNESRPSCPVLLRFWTSPQKTPSMLDEFVQRLKDSENQFAPTTC